MAALTTTLVRASRQRVCPVTSQYLTCRHGSSDVYREQSSNLTAYRRGRGGRSSFSGQVTTVFGASGYIGSNVVARLGRVGSQIIVPYRSDPYDVFHLSLCGDLGQVKFLPYHLADEDSIRKAVQYSNIVINLVGRDWKTKNFSLRDVHVDAAVRLARISKEMGVEKYVHISHLNAQPNPPNIIVKGGSQILRLKHEGEEKVREVFPEAIVFRPSDIYGLGDQYLLYYASDERKLRNKMPLWRKGQETVKMPVLLADVVEGIINSLSHPDAPGTVYEAVGPEKFRLDEIINFIYRCLRADKFKITNLTPEFLFWAKFYEMYPIRPRVQIDKLVREHINDKTSYKPTLEDLGVRLNKIEDRFPYLLRAYVHCNYYDSQYKEFAAPTPPAAILE